MGYLGWTLLFMAGMIMILKPHWMWRLECFMKMKTGEPSEVYLKTSRIGGILFCVAAAAGVLWSAF